MDKEGYTLQVKGDNSINTTAPNRAALMAMLLDQVKGLEPGSRIQLTVIRNKGAK